MSMACCRECGKDVSTQAVRCPHCGAPRPAVQTWNGTGFEWRSQATYLGLPLVHIAFGRTAAGKLRVARGIIAIGQFALGVVTIAQFGVGLLFGFGQFIFGATTIAQFAIGLLFGLGQFACGYVAIGQFAFGCYALAQIGAARFLWSMAHKDPQALDFFRQLGDRLSIPLADWMTRSRR